MSYHNCVDRGQSFDFVRQGFLDDDGLPFAEVLNAEQIDQVFAQHGGLFGQDEDDVFTPALTLWALLSQVIASGVQRLRTLCLTIGIQTPSPDSGAYCRARAKLPNDALRQLTYQVADALEAAAPSEWLWKGRHVKIVDGSTLMAPDTDENQAVWPQASSQLPGLGFPIMRLCLLVSLATGTVCGFAEGPYRGKETGEPALLRELFDRLQQGDVLVGDSCFCSFLMIALLAQRGVDVLFHQHQRRTTDFRKGERLGEKDHVVVWEKPKCPEWMDEETYASLPETITVRELRVRVTIPGCRSKEVTLVTTLTDATLSSKADLAALYRDRWYVETDLKSLKVTMNLEDLRGQTPEMVRKEIWAHLLAYNLIRRTMAAAAEVHDRKPRSISFAGGLQTVADSLSQASTAEPPLLRRLAEQKLESIASRRVGHRPNRVEPRAVKRRPKNQPLLTKPRDEARAALSSSVG